MHGHNRGHVERAAQWGHPEARRTVSALEPDFPIRVIRGDLTDYNGVCTRDDALVPDDVIDFGDLTLPTHPRRSDRIPPDR